MVCWESCSSEDHVSRQGRLETGVRELEPVEVVDIVGMSWWKGKSSLAVSVDDVFHDRATFGKSERPISDHWSDTLGLRALSEA